MFGDNDIHTFAAREFVSENFSAQNSMLPIRQTRCFALAASGQACGHFVLAPGARINNAPSYFDGGGGTQQTASHSNRML